MKKIEIGNLESISGYGGNCGGIYKACTTAAFFGGAAIIVGSAGLGIIFGVLAGGSAMEYCRQQYIGCH